MAEVQQNNTSSSSGIKLFGATISSPTERSRSQSNDDEEARRADQTADKRPDKIIPCPRCKSMETKFCYFNNYNVNQPRHFCKGCQRYWTAGGALRNVPVGAGRRKAKPPCQGLSEGCLFDAASGRVDFDDWEAAEHGGFGHLFASKRRRCGSNSQSC